MCGLWVCNTKCLCSYCTWCKMSLEKWCNRFWLSQTYLGSSQFSFTLVNNFKFMNLITFDEVFFFSIYVSVLRNLALVRELWNYLWQLGGEDWTRVINFPWVLMEWHKGHMKLFCRANTEITCALQLLGTCTTKNKPNNAENASQNGIAPRWDLDSLNKERSSLYLIYYILEKH